MRTVIKNVIVVTMNEARDIFNPGYLLFEHDTIVAAGPMKELTEETLAGASQIDGKQGILMP